MENSNSISVVTPTYNRKNILKKSIDSSIKLMNLNIVDEIIIVDDASTDDTFEYISRVYKNELSLKKLKIFRFDNNKGVSAAKAFGAIKSSGEWIIFLDSDDCFYDIKNFDLKNLLYNFSNYPLQFFRCIDGQTGKLVGKTRESQELKFFEYVTSGTPGECIPIINKKIFNKYNYKAEFRGCEGSLYYDIFCSNQKVYIHDKVLRVYDTSGTDRLSNKMAFYARSEFLMKYNIYLLRYFKKMGLYFTFQKMLKSIFYCLMYFTYKLFNSIKIKFG